eukprot:TRINITY_DN1626_c0_g1_i1.p1 TRINITY_DN1626_c0_g1~~TRINITY_DN1626_c0_g1_i1.p1  ORF type:complete len:75 (+),score=10.17 TRINITY_DN1626_c0_g1_i1:502-726(+)
MLGFLKFYEISRNRAVSSEFQNCCDNALIHKELYTQDAWVRTGNLDKAHTVLRRKEQTQLRKTTRIYEGTLTLT